MTYFLFCYLTTSAQTPTTPNPFWEVSGASSQFNFSEIGQRYGYGLMSEYYITDKISVRGGVLVNSNYIRFSIAPLIWGGNELIDMLSKRKTTSSKKKKQTHYHSTAGYGSKNTYPILSLLFSIASSDGFAYNFKLNNKLYIAPYIAPFQIHLCNSNGQHNFDKQICTTSIGGCLKGYLGDKFVIYVGAEYTRTFVFRDAGRGYSFNASIGYVFRK